MQEFLTGINTNKLLKSVLHDLNIPDYLAGTKALGLVSRLLTGPLWCFIEDKNMHILDMNEHYSTFLQCLEESSQKVTDDLDMTQFYTKMPYYDIICRIYPQKYQKSIYQFQCLILLYPSTVSYLASDAIVKTSNVY